MAISSFSGTGKSFSGFQIFTGTDGDEVFVLEEEQPAGEYYITSRLQSDYTFDIYVSSGGGEFSGYSTDRTLSASGPIKYVQIYGATAEDNISFDYKPVATGEPDGGVLGGVAPFITSISVSQLPSIGDTTVATGGNFADDVTVVFTGTDDVDRSAANIVKNSPTEIIVTRPADLPPDYAPYTLTFRNPGVPIPNTFPNQHILVDAVTSGTYPGWVSNTVFFWEKGSTNSITLVAEDTEQTDIDYEIISGSLFPGFSLDQETGIITGDDSALQSGDVAKFTVRAIDTGGQTAEKFFELYIDRYPIQSFYFDPFSTAGLLDETLLGNFTLDTSGTIPE